MNVDGGMGNVEVIGKILSIINFQLQFLHEIFKIFDGIFQFVIHV